MSSAYIKYDNLVLVFTMSLMYIPKEYNPNMEPCGIPVLFRSNLIEGFYISEVGNDLINNF